MAGSPVVEAAAAGVKGEVAAAEEETVVAEVATVEAWEEGAAAVGPPDTTELVALRGSVEVVEAEVVASEGAAMAAAAMEAVG